MSVPRPFPYELDIAGTAYHSGTPASGTQSLALDMGSDTGIHPVTTYRALNYDLASTPRSRSTRSSNLALNCWRY